MSGVFHNDIDQYDDKELLSLEDDEHEYHDSLFDGKFEYPSPLYKVKLEYSSEGVYATAKPELDLQVGDYVIIPTRYGKDLARVLGISKEPIGIKPSEIVDVERKANNDDLIKYESFKEKEEKAFKIFQEKVEVHQLDMKLIATHYLLEEQKVIFFFSADNRVDFRELVKDLVSVFKMRIELRQIGVRDESRITGGLGVCGRPYCCHAVSDRLRPVSIRMAKDQNLSLNSMKISGQCGRLLCCLSYEFECYTEARKKLPTEGIRLFYDGTNFRVTEINPLAAMVKMQGDDGRVIEVAASRFTNKDNKWRITE
jgi:cell fate regulator YaaT (PSP1 superfamily)